MKFFNRENSLFTGFLILVAYLLSRFLSRDTAVCFGLGCFSSLFCAHLGMLGVKTLKPKTFTRSIIYSALTGVSVSAFGLAAIAVILKYLSGNTTIEALNAFALGATFVYLFSKQEFKLISSAGFKSYVCTVVATMFIGSTITGLANQTAIVPLYIAVIGLLASLLGIVSFVLFHSNWPNFSHKLALIISSMSLSLGLYQLFSLFQFENVFPIRHALFYSSMLGVLLGLCLQSLMHIKSLPPLLKIPSTLGSLLLLTFCLIGSYYFAGAYGVGLASTSMLSTVALKITLEKFRKYPSSEEAAKKDLVSVNLDFISAALVSWTLFFAYSVSIGTSRITWNDHRVLMGFAIGAVVTFFLGKSKVEIGTHHLNKIIFVPAFWAFVLPVSIGLGLGSETLGGVLAGVIVTATFQTLFFVHKNDLALGIVIKLTPLIATVMAPLL